MKKFYIIISLVLWGFAQTIDAQNMYRNYFSGNISQPISAISVVHSNGYVYYFQTDNNGKISVTEINPLNMNPTGNANYYQLTMQNITDIEFHLNGGFEDANGRLVLFGTILYYDYTIYQHNQYSTFIIISSNLSTCEVHYELNSGGSYTAGCDGRDQNMGEVYIFLRDNELVVVEPSVPTNLYRLALDPVLNPNDYYTDISWDDTHNWFIVTGEAKNNTFGIKDPFVKVFNLINYNITTIAEYYVTNNVYSHASEYKSLHVQLDNDNLLLYHDLRRFVNQTPYFYDIIWLSRIENFWNVNTAVVNESWCYELPSYKLSAKDMLFNPFDNQLNILGEFNKCMDGTIQLLAQVNPYQLQLGIEIWQLGAGFTGGTCLNDQPPYINLAYNDLKMFNLVLNNFNPCWPVLIAGLGLKQSILTETYRISLSTCDHPFYHTNQKVLPNLYPYSLNNTQPLPTIPQQHVIIGVTDYISAITLCDDVDACSHQFGNKSSQFYMTNDKSTAIISFENGHQFVCEGFKNEIHYSLYDMTGKLLQNGVTYNGEYNSLKTSNGIYLLKCIDSNGKQVVKKIVTL